MNNYFDWIEQEADIARQAEAAEKHARYTERKNQVTRKTKQLCQGCRDDFYNKNRDTGCWSFATARVVKRVQVGTFEPPPYAKDRARTVLSCYHAEGYGFLTLDDCRVKEMR